MESPSPGFSCREETEKEKVDRSSGEHGREDGKHIGYEVPLDPLDDMLW